jgi:hypothetical protein
MSTTTQLLEKIEALNASGSKALTREPLRPRINALVAAGLLTSTSLKCGPLALPADEAWLRLTDDGRKLLTPNAN